MITEDYVSFETAKLLKEKGFNEICAGYYDRKGRFNMTLSKVNNIRWEGHYITGNISAPTIQMVMKWLRKKGIYISIVYGDYPYLKKSFWTPQIDSLEGFDLPDSFYKEYDEYEEAVDAAVKYCLKNLI